MADQKLSELTTANPLAGTELVYVVQDGDGVKATAQDIADLGFSGDFDDLSNKPTLGTAAALDAGTSANNVVQLDIDGKLPAVDGSALTGITGGGGSPGGSDTQVQFNDDGAFGGDAGLTFDKTTGRLTIGSSGSAAFSTDLIFRRKAAANLALGAADAAAPVAQTLSVQSVVAGTTNTAGADFTIDGSQGTGTGAGGSIVFRVAPAGSSGTAQNALATALTIATTGTTITAPGRGSGFVVGSGATNPVSFSSFSFSTSSGSGVLTSTSLNIANAIVQVNAFGALQNPEFRLGGGTSNFPTLRRNSTTVEVKLADNSAFTNIQGKLTTETAYTAGAPTATGYIVLYDSTGTAYKIPAEAV
jgi:hypothetical protein